MNWVEEWFEAFWKKYPRKINKKMARQSWGRIWKKGKDEGLFKRIVEAMERQADRLEWAENLRYCPHATTWLNQERWNDEVEDDVSVRDQIKERLYDNQRATRR